jgi:heterodisulfide reductase subunit C
MTTSSMQARAPTFFEQVVAATPGKSNMERCIQCGTCGGSCPAAQEMDHSPRAIFAMIKAELKSEVLKSNTPWYCVSCYYCTTRCPQEVHITDIMYTLKRIAVKEQGHDEAKAADFSKMFINWVENYGRAFELGLMSMHMIRHNPFGVFKIAGMGVGMVSKGRMAFTPERIKNIDQLKAILAKAKELEVSG